MTSGQKAKHIKQWWSQLQREETLFSERFAVVMICNKQKHLIHWQETCSI